MSYPNKDDLVAVQSAVNAFPYVVHGEAWEDICKRLEGDCKDYVLGKLHKLLSLGWPIETLRIGIVVVEPAARIGDETHAVLVVDDEHVLDNRQMAVSSVDGLARIGYEPVEIQQAGGHRTFVEWFWRTT
ncbi:MAG: transglutaminase-like cysteine peptidase [bacterium]